MQWYLLAQLIFSFWSPLQIHADQQYLLDYNSIQITEEIEPLLELLREKGFIVKFQKPPQKGIYGLFQSENKTLWVSPLSFELGIGRQTLLHEATHAAQSCPYDSLTPIGWQLPISPLIKREIKSLLYNRYDSKKYILEKEAFTLQGQKNAVALLLEAINERCK
tara:strand:+ start:342 stop:833 length:492 start_codon:yes stop_codon:yes gene_type:complete